MKKRYSKKVREEAALICAIAASGGWKSMEWSYGSAASALGIRSETAISLAWNAWKTLSDSYGQTDRERDAEAEALIRTGWSP